MAQIDNGSLHFSATMDNDQINAACEETLRRVQGLSDGTVSGGKRMDDAFNTTSQSIRAALGQIGTECDKHEVKIGELTAQYTDLGRKAGEAFMAGRDKEARAIQEQQRAVQGEISVRKQLLQELREQSNALEEEALRQEEVREKTETAAQAHQSFRTRLREVREELAELEQAGKRGTAEYQELQMEAGRLTDAMGDAQTQARILSHDNVGLQGVISAVNGVAGAMSVATGAVQLFGDSNEDLQKAMVKVQSVMAISIGLQQVMDTLNKDSAASLGLVGGLKRWWAGVVAQATAAETAETAATIANTAAQGANATATTAATGAEAANTIATGAQATAATAGTAANIGLAGAFRLVGAAIKSIPVFGWILAGISGLIALYQVFSSKAREAKKAQEEFSKAMIDGCYKPIGAIEELSARYTALGNNIKAKEKFIEDNKKKFEELGVSVNTVTDAENLLIANKERFVLAQIAKAKALVYTQQAAEKVKKLMELQAEHDAMPDTTTTYVTTSGSQWGAPGTYVTGKNRAKEEKQKEIDELTAEIKQGYKNAMIEEKNAAYNLKKGGIEAVQGYADGTVGAIEQAISKKQEALKNLKPNTKEWKDTYKQIAELQKQIANPLGGGNSGGSNSGGGKSGDEKDAYKERLNSYKKEYDRFRSWINSGDSAVQQAAKTEFSGLLKEGATYIDFLKKQRDEILSVDIANRTKEQNAQLRTLNDSIAEETKETVLSAFNEELSNALSNAKTAVEMLSIIEEKRKTLAGDGTEIDNEERKTLDDAESDAKAKQEEETQQLLDNYTSYLDKKLKLEQQYTNDIATLQKARANASTEAEREQIERAIQQRKQAYTKDATDISFNELKNTPEYIRAFEDLKNTSSETLTFLLERFEEVKESAAGALNPQDLQAYVNAMQSITDELNSRDPFTTIKNGYKELKAASNELVKAQRELNKIRNNGGQGTEAEQRAILAVNKAKDNYIKKNNEVKRAEKEVTSSVKELCNNLSEVGKTVGGQAGEIISLIGDVGSFTMSAIEGFQTASEASSKAIQTVEKASVILGIISTAIQVVQKIASIFGGDDGTAAYEKAEEAYKAYIDILDDVIDKQKELIASMTGENATNSYQYALSLIQQESDAARELGKQYLNAGAKKGFLGIGSSASHGVDQHDNISSAGWNQFYDVARANGIDASVADGRMTGLFDLAAEQLQKLKEDAPVFWAQLHEDTRTYLDAIIEATEKTEEMKDALNESLTGISFDSMKDDFVSNLQDMDMTAKTLSENFSEYMRKALINNMFKAQYQDKLKEYYQMWSDAMNPNGEGGSDITANEQSALDTLRDSIINGATAAAEKINEQFKTDSAEDDSLTGAVKGVTEETASIVAGQLNANRINILEQTEVLRQQLASLSAIEYNTGYNRYLQNIDAKLSQMQGAETSLRSQGLS